MSEGGSHAGLIVAGAAAGCLAVLCLGLAGGGLLWYNWSRAAAVSAPGVGGGGAAIDVADAPPSDAPPADALSAVAWGEVQLSATPTNVYAEADRSSRVLETREAGTAVEYYGLDGTASFFKVRTGDGTVGYVSTADAEMAVHQGEIKVIVESARVYATGSDSAGVLEVRSEGERLDWYGYDSSGEYYKVRTASGSNGYIRVTDATIP